MEEISALFDITAEDQRLTCYPIHRHAWFELYNKAKQSYWIPQEIDFSGDASDFHRLNAKEQHLVKYVLAFFAASDGLINNNLIERFIGDVPILEVRYFYISQAFMENIHAETYSIALDTIISNEEEKLKLLNAMKTIPVIEKMSNYIQDCTQSAQSFPTRLLKMACVEGIFFIGAFCVIYWLQNYKKGLMKGLAQSNELIARDETLHTLFAVELYKSMNHKLETDEVYRLFREAVNLAKEFIANALQDGLPEMNAANMNLYIESQADILLELLGLAPLFKSEHCFQFMLGQNLYNKTDFFSRQVTEYSKSSSTKKIALVEDF